MNTGEWMTTNNIDKWLLKNQPRKVYKITPLSTCHFCHGTGEVAERHPYGSTYATEYLTCDCVLEQLPEDFQDGTDEVEIHCIGIEASDAPEFEYDEELDR